MKLKETIYPKILFGCWLVFALLLTQTSSVYAIGAVWILTGGLGMCLTRKIVLPDKLQLLWMLFSVFALVSTIMGFLCYSGVYNYSRSIFLLTVVFTSLLPLPMANFLKGKDLCEKFFSLYRNFMLLCSCLGLFEFITKKQVYMKLIHSADILRNFETMGDITLKEYRTMLFFMHPIHYSMLLLCGGIALYYMPYKFKILNIAAYLLFFLNIVFTQSRTSWILAIVAVLMIFSKKKIKQKKTFDISLKKILISIGIIILIAVVIILFMVLPVFEEAREIILKRTINNDSKSPYGARLSNLSILGQIYQRYGLRFFFFGGGNGFAICYLRVHPTMSGWVKAIDNQFLTVMIDFGIFGFCTFMTFFGYAFYLFYKNDIQTRDISYIILFLILFSGFSYEVIGINTVYLLFSVVLSQLNQKQPSKLEDSIRKYFVQKGDKKHCRKLEL